MTQYRKKLIEVALPLKAINEASAREKSIRHGHPSTLHLWWARRPLAACRAVLFASLVDDPDSDPAYRKSDGTVDEDRAGIKRAELFNLIEDLVRWENSNNPRVINAARAEIARCVASRKIELGELQKDEIIFGEKKGQKHPNGPVSGEGITAWEVLLMKARPQVVNAFLAEHAPPVLDPFCGGGSIPLEAQRLGLRAYGSDLNPVPVLITKALIEIPPKFSGRPPVNPESRKQWLGNRKVGQSDALSTTDGVAEVDGSGEGSLSPGAAVATRGNLRDEVTDHAGSNVCACEHRRGMDSRIGEGEGAVPGDRPRVAGRDRDVSDTLRGDRLVRDDRDDAVAVTPDRGGKDADNSETQLSSKDLTPNSYSPKSYFSDFYSSTFYSGAAGLAEDVRYYGQWMRDEAEKRIGHLYPKVKITEEMARDRPDLEQYVGEELTVIAWLWARTVQCPNPGCRARAPLVRSFWLSKKKGKSCYARPVVGEDTKTLRFEIATKGEPPKHTTDRTGARCVFCDTFIKKGPLREIAVEHGVAEMPLAVVAVGNRGRVYLPGDAVPLPDVQKPEVPFLEQPITNDKRWFSPPLYGMPNFADLFTPRQLVALTTFSDLVQEAREKVLADARRAWGSASDSRTEPHSANAASASTARGSDVTTYHITFGTYGTRLHGDERPTVHHRRNRPGESYEPPDPARVQYLRESMRFEPVYLTDEQRRFIEQTLPALCERGGWTLHEAACQRDHVHVLLSAAAEGKAVRRWLKTWLSQVLNDRWPREQWWAKGGSCRLVGTERYFEAARQYVAKQRASETATTALSSAPPAAPSPEPPSVRAAPLRSTSRQQQEANEQAANTVHDSGADDRPLADGGTGPTAYADAVATYLAFAVSRTTNRASTICIWNTAGEKVEQTFGRQAIPMCWDFAEASPFSDSTGSWSGSLEWIPRVLESGVYSASGFAKQLDATSAINGVRSPLICTDPPYYDNVGYADLSDFFYIWLRRSLGKVYPQLFATLLTPKTQELIASPYRHDGNRENAQRFFEDGLRKAFITMRDAAHAEYPLTVYYAFKQAENKTSDKHGEIDRPSRAPLVASTGWETMLAGLIDAGFSLHGTWPIRTERDQGLKTGTNVLASSVVLSCRPRPADAPLATRKEFMNALRRELPEALKNFQHGNIAPVDLAQAAIGPGMAVFTRYSKVMETDGSPMTVRTALGIINQVLDEVLAEQEGDFDPETRWALAWFEQFGTQPGPFGVAETLSKAKNTAVNGLVEAGVVKARGGKVQLLGRNDLPDGWDPAADKRLTVWETTQHLIRTLQNSGESEAAVLLNKLGGMAETSRELAYRLFSICERNKWADEALAYNGLVIAWPELTKLARSAASRSGATQRRMF